MPCNHEVALGNGEQGVASFLTRYTLPPNGVDGFEGRWYAFRVGTVLFVCLSGDDVAAADASALVAAAAPLLAAQPAGSPPPPGAPRHVRGYSGGAQTRWLESTLAAARADSSIDWIVVQVHQCACSSAPDGNGSDLGVRQEWLPLFDTYEVDLVLSGHDHGYERSFPVRGADPWAGADAVTGAPADTRRPHPVTTVDSGVFDTSQGTVHLVLGSDAGRAGSGGPVPPPWERTARIVTRPPLPAHGPAVPGGAPRPAADAVEAGGVVRAARPVGRVRHRRLRRDARKRRRRPDVRHRPVLPRGRRGPGEPGPRRVGWRLHPVRDVYPDQAQVRRTAMASERLAAIH